MNGTDAPKDATAGAPNGTLRPIRTVYAPTPLPIRSFDWCAYFDGCEEDGNYGWGTTEQGAIKALMEMSE